MKTKTILLALVLSLFLTNCVQKTHKKTVVFTLDASEMKNVKKVAIRGKDKPLSWGEATEMKLNITNNTYKITTTFVTGYKFTEVKFVVNDSLEFENEDNRRVIFSEKDTTYYKAKFNKR